MYQVCPKCQYERRPQDQDDTDICPACGIFFSKWMKSQFAAKQSTANMQMDEPDASVPAFTLRIAHYLLYTGETTRPFEFWSRVVVFLIFLVWGGYFINMDFVNDYQAIGQSFMHNINLIFHEAGHIIFMPLGWFMTILGGSLFQVLMPLIVLFAFLVKQRNTFAASIMLWWTGQSLIDVSPYIDDALEQKLVLLGGHTGADAPGNHDWNNILNEFNILERHREFAALADTSGTILILLALA